PRPGCRGGRSESGPRAARAWRHPFPPRRPRTGTGRIAGRSRRHRARAARRALGLRHQGADAGRQTGGGRGRRRHPRDHSGEAIAMRVLLAEDEPRVAADVAAALERSGYAVDRVGDGEAAWFHGDTEDYDAAVLDL